MRVRFFNIDWDTDGKSPEECGLPTDCTLEVEDDLSLEDEGADALSDKYGFCVKGCSYEPLDHWETFEQSQDKCPKCDSGNICNEDGPDEQERLPVTCHDCGYQWYEPAT